MIPDKKTKIVCTIGPATETEEALTKLLKAGMNVMRLNFSHGDFAEHLSRVKNLRAATEKTGITAAILQDLGGPKIRIGMFKTESIVLKPGAKFTITTDEIEGDETRVSVNYPNFAKEVAKGHIVFLHDGKKKLEVLEVKGNDVICKVIVGGDIKGKRGVNLPDSDLTISSITEKDRKDLEFGIKNKVDFIALSFVRHAKDIVELREILKKAKSQARIIAKIETPQAIKHIDEIISLADGIMVARGDLAIEVPAEQVPALQKMIIKKCNEAGKPVITATQMLESMIKSPVPTRAEVSDVANAIIDGTDAIMLSEETTLGDFPLEAVEVMNRVAVSIEATITNHQLLRAVLHTPLQQVGESVTASVVKTADRIGAKYVVALTNSGTSARLISRFKPNQPVIVFTPNESTFRQTILSSGTYPVLVDKFAHLSDAIKVIRQFFIKKKLVKTGDKIVIATGSPFGKNIETNMMVVETM
ncbi:MAG: pyruvate kinase [bacterium]